MATIAPPVPVHPDQPDGQRFVLRAVDWEEYQNISHALRGRHLRMAYDGRSLELMTISHRHGNCSRLLGRLVVVLTEEFGLSVRSAGDMTCERKDVAQGIEPDECFYIAHEPVIRDKDEVDLAVDPPPDLGIEIDVTRSSLNRLGIYAALKVPEVWRFDGEKLQVYQLDPGGHYQAVDHSRFFPAVPIGEIAAFLQRRTTEDENRLARSFREWVRQLVD